MTWVIGNGQSRQNVKLDKLQGSIVGCNALCRDFVADHLVCADRRMVREALTTDSPRIYTRTDWIHEFKKEPRVNTVPKLPYKGKERADDPFQWGSGPYAVLVGALTLSNKVNLLGFDLYSETKNINNIYKGTQNYNKEDYRAVDPRYWIHQIGKVFKHHKAKQFIIYQKDGWELPKAWNYPNVSLDKISKII